MPKEIDIARFRYFDIRQDARRNVRGRGFHIGKDAGVEMTGPVQRRLETRVRNGAGFEFPMRA
jgi:hypothetical protein